MNCTKCGALLRTGAKFCNACGTPQTASRSFEPSPKPPPTAPAHQPQSQVQTIFWIIAAILMLLVALVKGYNAFFKPTVAGQSPSIAASSQTSVNPKPATESILHQILNRHRATPAAGGGIADAVQTQIANDKLQRELDEIAADGAKILPLMVASNIKAIGIESEPGLLYIQTFVITDADATNIPSDNILAENQKRLIAKSCKTELTRSMLDNGVTIMFKFLDPQGRTLGNHSITLAMCN